MCHLPRHLSKTDERFCGQAHTANVRGVCSGTPRKTPTLHDNVCMPSNGHQFWCHALRARSLRADPTDAVDAEAASGGGELLRGPAVLSHLVASLLALARCRSGASERSDAGVGSIQGA